MPIYLPEEPTVPAIPLTDPRVTAVAKARQQLAHDGTGYVPAWGDLTDQEREQSLPEARNYLEAAICAGLIPAATPPSDDHEAVYLDDHDEVWADYPTSPPGDYVLRLVWASEEAVSKRDLADQGVPLRVIGWSK